MSNSERSRMNGGMSDKNLGPIESPLQHLATGQDDGIREAHVTWAGHSTDDIRERGVQMTHEGRRRSSWIRMLDSMRHVDDDGVMRRQIMDDILCRGASPVRARRRGAALTAVALTAVYAVLSLAGGRGPPAMQQKLMSAAALCAGTKDLFDPHTHMCKSEDNLAFASFASMPWASCDTSLPGAAVLQNNMDERGALWYPYSMRGEVDAFYRTCKPACALGSTDWYDSASGVCVSTNTALNTWLETCKSARGPCMSLSGAGLKCERNSAAVKALRIAVMSQPSTPSNSPRMETLRVSYSPHRAQDVRNLALSCSTMCVGEDKLSNEDGRTCRVRDSAALRYLAGGIGSCDGGLPGAR
jgi:hypothetical protein